MTSAIYFPQPIDADDHPEMDLPEQKDPTPVRKRLGLIAGTALVIALAWFVGSALLSQTDSGVPISASGIAEIVTRQHITASGDRFVGGTAVVTANQIGPNWRFVVAAEQLTLAPEGYVRDGMHYYEWELTADESAWRVNRGPAEVAGPPGAQIEPTELPPPIAAPTTVAIQSYLEWLLTGADGTHSGPRPTPPPYVSVSITGLLLESQSTDIVTATAGVRAVDRFGHSVDLSYRLALEQHRDSWIVAIDALPR